jgi:hypothetical protein
MTIPYDSNYDPAALILPTVLSGVVRHRHSMNNGCYPLDLGT